MLCWIITLVEKNKLFLFNTVCIVFKYGVFNYLYVPLKRSGEYINTKFLSLFTNLYQQNMGLVRSRSDHISGAIILCSRQLRLRSKIWSYD